MNLPEFENRRWRRGGYADLFRHRAARDLFSHADARSALDIGCGDGAFFASLGIPGVGLDISQEAVRQARTRGIDARIHDVAGSSLPFPDDSFDAVILLDTLEHLYEPRSLLVEARRVSRRYVIVSVPNFNSAVARFQVLIGRVPENNTPQKGHIYWFSGKILLDMAQDAGLTLRAMRVNAPLERMPGIGAVSRLFSRLFPSLFSLSFVALFEI